MASSISSAGAFRSSVILKSKRPIDPDTNTPLARLPPPVSSVQMAQSSPSHSQSTYSDIPTSANGEKRSKEEDHYGFLYSMSEKDQHYAPLLTGKKAREREQKWLKMLENWDFWMEKKAPKVKERCRKGIPPSLRGQAWQKLSGARKLLLDNAGLFDDLIGRPDNDVVLNVIDKDLDRTFPTHVLFSKPSGQEDLRKVLKAYAMYNIKTGYCQAMAPVAATLLMHMTAECVVLTTENLAKLADSGDVISSVHVHFGITSVVTMSMMRRNKLLLIITQEAFWVLVQICEQYLPGYYSPGLHAFQIDALILKDLLKKHLPNIKHFMDSKLPPNPSEPQKGLDPMLYCTEWFMSVFTRSLPWGTVLRVLDMFFFEGPKVLFKVALAVLSLSFGPPKAQAQITGFFELTRSLRSLPIEVTHESVLIPEVLKFRITREELHKYHLAQADVHFTEERVRQMELQARRLRLHRNSIVSEAASSEIL